MVLGFNSCPSVSHLLGHLHFDFFLDKLLLATNSGDCSSWVLSSAVLSVVSVHDLGAGLAVDAVSSVVELLTMNGVLEVEMALRDVLFRYSPKNNRHLVECTFGLPKGP